MTWTIRASGRAPGVLVGLVVTFSLFMGQAASVANPVGASPAAYLIELRPTSGPSATVVSIRGRGFGYGAVCNAVEIRFLDAQGLNTDLGPRAVRPDGTLRAAAQIPSGSAIGDGSVLAVKLRLLGRRCEQGIGRASATFTVTR